MKPLKRMNLKDAVVEKLHKYIVDHQLLPGDRFLNEKEIINLVGVSRTVVREALQALVSVGVLWIKPGDGIFVNESSMLHLVNQFAFRWSRDQSRMLELLETRLMLELSALDLVIKKLNDKSVDAIVLLNELDLRVDQMSRAIDREESIVDEDIAFHRTLFKLTGNKTFYELSEVITQYFDGIRKLRLSLEQGYAQTLTEHNQILSFIKAKDLHGARAAMTQHLSSLQMIILDGEY